MKKQRWLALSTAMLLIFGNVNQFCTMADEQDSSYLGDSSTMVEDLVRQDNTTDMTYLNQIKAVLYNCTEYGLKGAMDSSDEEVKLYSGQQLILHSYIIAEDGSKWYEVSTSVSGVVYTGYIPAAYVLPDNSGQISTLEIYNKASDETTSGEAELQLVEDEIEAKYASRNFENSIAAFPESYKDYLRVLHNAHPNWIFVPQITNIDWNAFINAEMVQERNLVPRSMDDSYKGKQSWAYNSQTGEYYGLSGYNWVQASEAAVAYYADPRNFLNEQDIFQFELLTYNSAYQTEEGVEAILNGTFMSHTMLPDNTITYANAFCQAGSQTNVSPYMLASRVRQEQGIQGTSPLISGNYQGYEGYYNYFNIGAYGTTETDIYVNGLERAKSNGWNSRINSIVGGASVLGGNYITKGQDTLYLQKFDVDASYYGLYSHQYMQNVLGAYNEGRSAYQVYSNIGIINNNFVFKIPVYMNMPVTAVPKPDSSEHINESIQAFIVRLYQNILGRQADESGMQHWYKCLTTGGETAAAVVTRFVFSTEFVNQNVSDEEFVERLYMTMLNRASDSSGREHWLQLLSDGCSRRYVLSRFVASQEFAGICVDYGVARGTVELVEKRDLYIGATQFVTRLYRTALKREPDIDGLNHWVGLIGNKQASPYDVAMRIIKSTEFTNYNYSNDEYVLILYRVFLNREPDESGYEHWIHCLNTGVPREEILRRFAYSEEFKVVAKTYGL